MRKLDKIKLRHVTHRYSYIKLDTHNSPLIYLDLISQGQSRHLLYLLSKEKAEFILTRKEQNSIFFSKAKNKLIVESNTV